MISVRAGPTGAPHGPMDGDRAGSSDGDREEGAWNGSGESAGGRSPRIRDGWAKRDPPFMYAMRWPRPYGLTSPIGVEALRVKGRPDPTPPR